MTEENLKLLSSLEPDEEVILISLAKSMLRNRNTQTEAHKKFLEMRQRYKERDLSMKEIDMIIHNND